MPTQNSLGIFELRSLQSWSEYVPASNKGPMVLAFCIIVSVFGFGGYWAATAPLGGAVITTGRVVAKGNNVAVQNLEGGIISDIFVQEGQAVKRGDTLARMDTTSVSSQLQRVRIDRDINIIELERWRLEKSGAETPFDIKTSEKLVEHSRVREALESQISESTSARQAFNQELTAIDGQIQNEQEDLIYLASQLDQNTLQRDLVGNERTNLGTLQDKGLIANSRILSLDREISRLEAERSNITATIAKSYNNIDSLRQNKMQLQSEREVVISENITDLQKRLTAHEDQVTRLEDILRRSDLTSPVDGIVLNVPIKSIGGVVQPGETIVEILPSEVSLQLEAFISPNDINNVTVGQPAEVIFNSDQDSVKPPLSGEVVYLSADALLDVVSGKTRYVSRVELESDWNGRNILPGMVAEVYFQTQAKTLVEILSDPIAKFARRTFPD